MPKNIRLFPGFINFQEVKTGGPWVNPNTDLAFFNTVNIRWQGENNYNFLKEHPIQSDIYTDKYGDQYLVYVDGVNNARFLKIPTSGEAEDPLPFFPSIGSIPQIVVEEVSESGGSLRAGSYFFAMAKVHSDGTSTNFYDVIGPVPISEYNYSLFTFAGTDSSRYTSKSIRLSLNASDDGLGYDKLRIAVIPVYDGIIDEVQLLPDIDISLKNYTYSGNEAYTPGSLAEIQIDQAFYESPSTVHINEDVTYMGNFSGEELFDYQRYANLIQVVPHYEERFAPPPEAHGEWGSNYPNPVTSLYKKGFKRGEVYAFYISWILKEGGESPAFHIPGRNPLPGEGLQADSNDPTRMGLFLNANELYPNTDKWDSSSLGGRDLRGLSVRHHMFPIETAKSVHDPTNNVYNILGFKLQNVSLPSDLRSKVVGYKVYYAKRTEENKRYLDQGLAIRAKVDDNQYKASVYNDSGVNNAFYLHPFHYMRTRKNLGRVNAIRSFRRYNTPGSGGVSRMAHIENKIGQNLFLEPNNIAYVDAAEVFDQDVIVGLPGFNVPSINQRNTESKIVVALGENLPNPSDYHVIDLCAEHENLYNSFDQQELVSTGYIHTNLNNTDSAPIFGGDTYITVYYFKTTSSLINFALHKVILESVDNLNYRSHGDQAWETFLPFTKNANYVLAHSWKDGNPNFVQVTGFPPDLDYDDNPDVVTYDNYYNYNESYSRSNDFKFPTIHPKFDRLIESYPTRIIRNKKDEQRTFLQNDYLDLSTKRGDLIKLDTFNNILIAHMEQSLIRTRGREDVQVGDTRAFMGTGDIFAVKPEELIYSENGFGGISSNQHSLSTPYGYFFYDQTVNRFYGLTHDGLQDISSSILSDLRDTKIDNLVMGYDPHWERILFSYNGNETYSYYPKIGNWMSRHDYFPQVFFNTKTEFYSASTVEGLTGTRIYKHNTGKRGQFYDEYYPSFIILVSNQNPHLSKVARAIVVNMKTIDRNGNILKDKSFDKYRVYNSWQDTGLKDVVYNADYKNNPYIANTRKTKNLWIIKGLRDTSNLPNLPQRELWKYSKYLEDHYHVLEIIKENTSRNEKFVLIGADITYKESIR